MELMDKLVHGILLGILIIFTSLVVLEFGFPIYIDVFMILLIIFSYGFFIYDR